MSDSSEAEAFRQNKERCEKIRDALLSQDPRAVFIMNAIKRLNPGIDHQKIVCLDCTDNQSGGFDPEHGIMLCATPRLPKAILRNTLSHELIHAYDHSRFEVDWGNIDHHACSEIRASGLSGECAFSRELLTGNMKSFQLHFQECIKRRAIKSVSKNPNCPSVEAAEAAVDKVFASCFRDTRPFETFY